MEFIRKHSANIFIVALIGGFATIYLTTGNCPSCLITGLAGGDEAVAREEAEPRVKDAAPEWSLTDLDGNALQSKDFAGKVVVLNFWATWCGPCRKEIPDFVAVQESFRDRGVQFIGLSLDQGDPNEVRAFSESNKINYPVAIADFETVEKFGQIEYIPTTFIITPDNRIVGRHVGGLSRIDLEKLILPFLPQEVAKAD